MPTPEMNDRIIAALRKSGLVADSKMPLPQGAMPRTNEDHQDLAQDHLEAYGDDDEAASVFRKLDIKQQMGCLQAAFPNTPLPERLRKQ